DRLSVGRHVERNPGPFRRREVDAAGGLQGQRVWALGGERQTGGDGGDEHRGREPTHHWTPGSTAMACRERSRKPATHLLYRPQPPLAALRPDPQADHRRAAGDEIEVVELGDVLVRQIVRPDVDAEP